MRVAIQGVFVRIALAIALQWFLPISALALASPSGADLPVCGRDQLQGIRPTSEQITAHRPFELPVISYPFGSQTKLDWGLTLLLRVDETGRVVCYFNRDRRDREITLTPQRQEAIKVLAASRYTPFNLDAVPVAALVMEELDEHELPERHLSLPEVPLAQVHITLERGKCFGACPVYRVDVHGDGRVVYEGKGHVDIRGIHATRIPTADVAKLIDSLRQKDLWSLRPSYSGRISDNPLYRLTLRLGKETHVIEDYVGQMAGMPLAVTQFEVEVDKAARTAQWIKLSQAGVAQLREERFAFASAEGAAILLRSAANEYSQDNVAMQQLLELGAPIARPGLPSEPGLSSEPADLLVEVLENRRANLVAPLLARGALRTAGTLNQKKIDAAFQSAVSGGLFAPVKQIWNAAGARHRPSLRFLDSPWNAVSSRDVDILLALERKGNATPWQGLQITRFLIAHGSRLTDRGANGRTLLTIAASANDVELVRYLLKKGLDPSQPGEFGWLPIRATESENVAMLLLEAGTNLENLTGDNAGLVARATDLHWSRVVAWIAAHPH